jgi:DNA-binding response OmpR family regulator
MDGYNFMLAMKEHHETAGIPVILVTSKASIEEEEQALKAGFIDFIGKPITPVRVVARVDRVLANDKIRHQTVINNPVGADLQSAAFATKTAWRASLQRREVVSRVESNSPKSKHI